jgi:multisubunit Na+/H+ antiporter MnhG subunit
MMDAFFTGWILVGLTIGICSCIWNGDKFLSAKTLSIVLGITILWPVLFLFINDRDFEE